MARDATAVDPIARFAALVADAERAAPHERAAAIIRARYELDDIAAALDDADDALATLSTPAMALIRPTVELRRRTMHTLMQRLTALAC